MCRSVFNDLQKFINDLRKLVLFFTQALYAASAWRNTCDNSVLPERQESADGEAV
jgi:hypothetical protein